MDDADLQLNFAMCFDHFQHNEPNSTDISPNEKSESIEVVETPPSSNQYKGPLQESTISSASTNNTDICVLDSQFTNDEHFLPDDDLEDKEFFESEGDEVFLRSVNVLGENEDFTVVRKPPVKSRRLCNCEESTEVLMLINSEYPGNRKPTYSDSDVEVLMSEELIESDWLSANNEDKNDNSLTFESGEDIKEDKRISTSQCNANSMYKEQSTDSDISGAELGEIVENEYSNLNRSQLLEIIQQQEVRIQALEATVERYHKAQQRLFEHVDALRLELSEIRISPSLHLQKEPDITRTD